MQTRTSVSFAVLLLAGFLLTGSATRAQAQDRGELIRQAEQFYQNFQTEPALNNLRAALDPTRGEPDSIWAHGVHLLAQIYYESGDTAQATTWLRWAFRTDPGLRVNRSLFLPQVLTLSDAARAWVRRTESEGDFVTDTRFEWPVGRMVPQTGSLRIDNAGLGVPLRVLVQGTGDPQARPVPEGVTATLGPGSYEVQAAADGYLGVRITRVVLPGVTTVLKFNLQAIGAAATGPPTLVDPLLGRLRGGEARLSVWRFGRGPTCAAGFYAGTAFLVTTYEAIKGADSTVVTNPDGSRVDNRVVRVALFDTARNVAVLKLPVRRDSLPLNTTLPRRGQWVWPLAFTDCNSGTVNNRAVRVGLGADPIELGESTQGAQLGGALVDSTGAVLGLTYRGDRAIPAATLASLVDEARQRDRAGQLMTLASVTQQQGLAPRPGQQVAGPAQVSGKKGGFPIIIVVGGIAAAGGAAALLLLGGKSGSPPPGTGSIFIRFPNP
jgi:hypothetical protein